MSTPAEEDASELRWVNETYQKGARQLTVRAVVVGMFLGAIMCLSNLYVVLKTGWSLGVTITACILAYGLFQALKAARIVREDFSILENNAMGSVASAAGYMTGGGNMAALPALLMLTTVRPSTISLMVWFALIAALGVFVAIPIKRQLVNREQLPFPTGTATAETLRSMHAHGPGNDKARMLGLSGLAGAVIAWFRDAKGSFMPFNLPSTFGLPFSLGGQPAIKWTLGFEGSMILVGVGAIIGIRTGWSMLIGALVTYGFLAPWLVAEGIVKTISYKAIVQWTLWPGAAILVSSGLLSFAFQWKSIGRSFSGLFSKKTAGADPMAEIECPSWWCPAGIALLSPFIVFLMHALFGIPIWAGIMAIPLAFAMGLVASRVTGETDITPTKALGPVTQFIFGAAAPGNMAANLMSANVTGGVGLHAADLLTDLKSGFLLGANPRQQFVGQLFGVLAGALVVVPAYYLLVPDPALLGTPEWPAPAVMVWAGVSKILVEGMKGLHPTAKTAATIGLFIGVVLTLLERNPRIKKFSPSPSGLGIAMVIPGFNSISMFIGSLIAEVLFRRRPAQAERLVLPVSSGLIAGESLMGILVAILVAFGFLTK